MNWDQAVEAMRRGATVRRVSESIRRELNGTNEGGTAVYEEGQEGCMLAHAWTVDEKPALVFMGQWSKCLFVPDAEHRAATDWLVV